MSAPPTPPLTQLRSELAAAARRLDAAQALPRRRWLHGWTLVAVIAVASSGFGVAAAQVGGLDPFGYLNGGSRSYTGAARADAIAVQDDAREPTWQAQAFIAKQGQICITGGPADRRTNPDATPVPPRALDAAAKRGRPLTPDERNAPPYAGMTCSDSDSVAQLLVDRDFPGTTFTGSNALNGHPDPGTVVWMTGPSGKRRKGRMMSAGPVEATRLIVYAVAADGGPEPRLRFGATGPLQPMRRSERTMLMKVDKSPQGLSEADRRTVAGFPDEIALRLWAGALTVPKSTRLPQTVVPQRAADAEAGVIEMVSVEEMMERGEASAARGELRRRGIERFPKPVSGVTGSTKRWVAAFDRPRTGADTVPERSVDDMLRRQRVGVADSRRLTTVGGGLGSAAVWVAPGGYGVNLSNGICLVGAPVLGQCKTGTHRWKQPLVEAIVCSPRLDPKTSLVWGLAPRGATSLSVVEADGARTLIGDGELALLRRPHGNRLRALVWHWPSGREVRVRVPWPKPNRARCGKGDVAWTDLRRDNQGMSAAGHGGPWNR